MQFSLSSRVHRLNHFPQHQTTCYVKRDDELSCGISGSKWRKYASLMPYLLQQGVQRLLIIAGSNSNNLLAALQMAREHQLAVTAFLLQPKHQLIHANFKLSSLFLESKDIIWVEREQWPKVHILAEQYRTQLVEASFILAEGASVPEALIGAQSLAQDIITNEAQLGLSFQHIFIDAGTGFMAAALIKGLTDSTHQAKIHVLLLADDQSVFHHKLQQWTGLTAANYCCFKPTTAKSFGAVNYCIKQEIRRVAQEEGILVEPIYSAKLFYESRRYIEQQQLQGNVLIIHSGGLLTLGAL